jgi:hypothetical protein
LAQRGFVRFLWFALLVQVDDGGDLPVVVANNGIAADFTNGDALIAGSRSSGATVPGNSPLTADRSLVLTAFRFLIFTRQPVINDLKPASHTFTSCDRGRRSGIGDWLLPPYEPQLTPVEHRLTQANSITVAGVVYPALHTGQHGFHLT